MKYFATAFCFSAFVLSSLCAAPMEDADLLKVLLDNGTITQQQYERLKKEATEKSDQHIDVRVSTDGGLRASTYDGKFALNLGAFFASDIAVYRERKNPLGNGTEFRNARLQLDGTVFNDWDYEFCVDFADANADIKDIFVTYRGFDSFALSLGQFKPPFSLEQLSSRKGLTFMERALPNALVPDRKIGASAGYHGDLWTASAGIFGRAFDEDADKEGDEGWTTSGRFTLAPVHSDTRVLHVGASAAYEAPNDDGIVKIDAHPESHLTSVSFLDTGKIKNVRDRFSYGIESAIVYGPFSVQGEYIHSSLGLNTQSKRPVLRGGYAFASWMITGESRNYDFTEGAFERIKPDRTYGAVELAVRYSALNLNSPPLIAGGREHTVTLGLNWYVNPNMRFMANYVLIQNDPHATDNGAVHGEDNPGVFQARVQLDF